jgi:LmbE family N-acetylglucosaminyl deacetylase
MTSAEDVLERLRLRKPVTEPAALVAAHPDDETIGAGVVMPLFQDLMLIHVTNGAPADMADAHRAGFETPEEYAATRRCELQDALACLGAAPRRIGLGVRDQDVSNHLAAVAGTLRERFREHGTQIVLTHPYEGGHPDHDSCAFAVHLAARLMETPPVLLEFGSYHAGPDGAWEVQTFLTEGQAGSGSVITLELDPSEQDRKRDAFRCFASQRLTLTPFDPAKEIFRAAPAYDFSKPPHDGELLYERHGGGMTGARWRALAQEALEQLSGN